MVEPSRPPRRWKQGGPGWRSGTAYGGGAFVPSDFEGEARGDIHRPIGTAGKRVVERLTAWRSEAALMDALIALMTTVLLLVPISVVGVVLAWADSGARQREATEVRHQQPVQGVLGGSRGRPPRKSRTAWGDRETSISRDTVGPPPRGRP